jgi:hypothetical protein
MDGLEKLVQLEVFSESYSAMVNGRAKHETVIVQQDGQAGVPALASESEIRFQEHA